MKKFLFGVAVAATTLGITSAPALAGEITGNGRSLKTSPTTIQGRSACAWSGLNDEFVLLGTGTRTQSYATDIVHTGAKKSAPTPGYFCNPNTVFVE